MTGFLGLTQAGPSGLELRPLIGHAIYGGSNSPLLDQCAWIIVSKADAVNPSPGEAPEGSPAELVGLYQVFTEASLCQGAVKLHKPRLCGEGLITFGAVTAAGGMVGALACSETRSGGWCWCYVPVENLTEGPRVILGESLGEVLQELLEDHSNEASTPYFLQDGYKAPGVWVNRKTQHWVSGQGYVNVGPAGVGWCLDDPAAVELPQESDEVDSDASDYKEFDSSPFSLAL